MNQLSPKYKLDEIQKSFENFVESIGYTQRIDSYFTIREDNGYINVYREYPSKKIYNFHKNFFQNKRNPHHDGSTYKIEDTFFGYNCIMTNSSIQAYFNRYSDFKNFLANYHTKQGRKLKLNKIYEKK